MCCSLPLTRGNGGDARVARGDRRLLLLCHVSDLCCDVVYAVIITGIEYQVIYVTVLSSVEFSWQFDAPTVLGLSSKDEPVFLYLGLV